MVEASREYATVKQRAFNADTELQSGTRAGIALYTALFHELLLRSCLYRCVWSVITAHNLTSHSREA